MLRATVWMLRAVMWMSRAAVWMSRGGERVHHGLILIRHPRARRDVVARRGELCHHVAVGV
eukprot:2396845-Pyramimonas_sp.AAC.1